MQLYHKQKKILIFFLAFLKSISSFKHMPKKMILIDDAFTEIPAPKNIVS